jgi:hypothetical protein
VFAATLIALYAASFSGFTAAYFGTHRERIGAAFFDSFGDATLYAVTHTGGPVCFTGQVNMPYIFVLFLTAADPHVFLETVRYANPGAAFQWVAGYDRYSFGPANCAHRPGTAYVLRRGEPLPLSPQALRARAFKHFVVLMPDG